MANEDSLQCYNRGCGKKYHAKDNIEDSCRHHPGEPIFHDAYKGWSCCNKKCTDFTEFLNIQGCTLSNHSNVKPAEPEKPKTEDIPDIIELPKQLLPQRMKRPPLDTPLVTMNPVISSSLQQMVKEDKKPVETIASNTEKVAIGTACQNRGCLVTYEVTETDKSICTYHPGVPIFHEGLKYWSCCQRKTTDFNTFLSQVGCQTGNHVWTKDESDSKTVHCRWDFHQTGSHVVVSIYAKQYCPRQTVVKLNPVRLFTELIFPEQPDAKFTLDIELKGIINVKDSQVYFYGTKVEIKMKKAEIECWSKLGEHIGASDKKESENKLTAAEQISTQVESVDLSDL